MKRRPRFYTKIVWSNISKLKQSIFNLHNSSSGVTKIRSSHGIRNLKYPFRLIFFVMWEIIRYTIHSHDFYKNLYEKRYCSILWYYGKYLYHHCSLYLIMGLTKFGFNKMLHRLTIFEKEAHCLMKYLAIDGWLITVGLFLTPRSLQLSPLEYYIWGFVKYDLFCEPVTTNEVMINKVIQVFNAIEG